MRINYQDAMKMFSSMGRAEPTDKSPGFQRHYAENVLHREYPELSDEMIQEMLDILYWFGDVKWQYGMSSGKEKRHVGDGMDKYSRDKRHSASLKNSIATLKAERDDLMREKRETVDRLDLEINKKVDAIEAKQRQFTELSRNG